MRAVLRFFLHLGAWGLLGMGILDSSILFLPFGNDLLVVALTARHPQRFWLYALAATAGSLMGCTITDWLSRKVGEKGIESLVDAKKVEKLQQRLKTHSFWVLGGAALMPPPFPFTIFLIAASAIQIARWRVLTSVGVGRFLRFVLISLLARRYGTHLIALSKRPEFRYFIIGLAVVSVIGSVFSVLKWVRSTRRPRPEAVEANA